MADGSRAAQLVLRHVDVEATAGDVEHDEVAGPRQDERAPGRRLRGDVQDDGAVRRPAHAPVADADHVAHPSANSFLGSGRFATSGMPG